MDTTTHRIHARMSHAFKRERAWNDIALIENAMSTRSRCPMISGRLMTDEQPVRDDAKRTLQTRKGDGDVSRPGRMDVAYADDASLIRATGEPIDRSTCLIRSPFMSFQH